MSREDDIRQLVVNLNRRLQKLKEQKALHGIDTSPHILIEIENIEAEIEQLEAELKALQDKDTRFHIIDRKGTRAPPPSPYRTTIQQCKDNLLNGKDADTSARTLGDIAIEHKEQASLHALWEAICETRDLRAIIDPCAYTVGRVVRESTDSTLEDIGFDIFSKSVIARTELIVDKFAFTIGEVALKATESKTRQRAKEFIHAHASAADPLIRRCYDYTKRRISNVTGE